MTWRNPIHFHLYYHLINNPNLHVKIQKWVKENFGPDGGMNGRGSKRYRWNRTRSRLQNNITIRGVITGIEFADEDDAMAFKLRWF